MSDPVFQVILSAGSNIEPVANLSRAREILSGEQTLLDEATTIQTPPDGYQDQDDFLNTAFLLETPLPPDRFKDYLREVEVRLKRVKGPIKSGPRTIDLDIIVVDGKVVHTDYPVKDYVRIPVDELLSRNQIPLEQEKTDVCS